MGKVDVVIERFTMCVIAGRISCLISLIMCVSMLSNPHDFFVKVQSLENNSGKCIIFRFFWVGVFFLGRGGFWRVKGLGSSQGLRELWTRGTVLPLL